MDKPDLDRIAKVAQEKPELRAKLVPALREARTKTANWWGIIQLSKRNRLYWHLWMAGENTIGGLHSLNYVMGEVNGRIQKLAKGVSKTVAPFAKRVSPTPFPEIMGNGKVIQVGWGVTVTFEDDAAESAAEEALRKDFKGRAYFRGDL